MLKEARFSFRHPDCWQQETTERYAGVTLVVSGIYLLGDDVHVDLLLLGADRDVRERAFTDWARDPRIRKIGRVFEGPRASRFHATYPSAHSIFPHILRHAPVSIGTITMAGGVEHYGIVGEPDDVDAILRDLRGRGSLQVESIRNAPGPGLEAEQGLVSRCLSSLTDRQLEALVLAHERGYFAWPRRVSATRLAAKAGLSVSTFLDHLRQAEAKTLRLLLDELRADEPARFDAARARAVRKKRAS